MFAFAAGSRSPPRRTDAHSCEIWTIVGLNMTDLQVVTAAVIGIEILFVVAALCWPRRRWPADHKKQPADRQHKRYRELIAGRV